MNSYLKVKVNSQITCHSSLQGLKRKDDDDKVEEEDDDDEDEDEDEREKFQGTP